MKLRMNKPMSPMQTGNNLLGRENTLAKPLTLQILCIFVRLRKQAGRREGRGECEIKTKGSEQTPGFR